MPQNDVLEADERVRPNHARETRDALRHHWIALVRHRGGALLASPERLHHLADLRSCEMSDLCCEAVERRGEHCEGPEQLGVAVTRNDLCRRRLSLEPEPLAHDALDLRFTTGVDADCAGQLADAHPFDGPSEPVAVTVELERPTGELCSEGDRLGVDAVGSADHRGRTLLVGSANHGCKRVAHARENERARLPYLERQSRVEHVGRRQAEMEPPG